MKVNVVPHLPKSRCHVAKLAALSLAAHLASLGALAAQTTIAEPPLVAQLQSPTGYLLSQLSPNATLPEYIQRLTPGFRNSDFYFNGEISQADIFLCQQRAHAFYLSTFLAPYIKVDLDGDGVVTADEIRRTLAYDQNFSMPVTDGSSAAEAAARAQVAAKAEEQVRKLMAADIDNDGRVTFDEARTYAASLPDYDRFAVCSPRISMLLKLAPAGKSVLTWSDYVAAAAAVFNAADADGNGTISSDELTAYRLEHGRDATLPPITSAPPLPQTNPASPPPPPALSAEQERAQREAHMREVLLQEQQRVAAEQEAQDQRLRQMQARRDMVAARQRESAQRAAAAAQRAADELRAACAMPKASDAAKVVLIGSQGPEALSSVTIGSQEAAVSAGTIKVERGAEPIYLVVVSFEPAIWRIVGDVGRIERLVLTAGATPPRDLPRNKSLVGATGVAADKITFLPRSGCFSSFTVTPSTAAATAAGAVMRDAGKEVTTTAAAQSFAEVAVPSGAIHSLEGRNANKLMVIHQAGGSLKIEGDPRNIVIRSGPRSAAEALKIYRPGGVMQIDPNGVVATMPVERYAVLPEEAGLSSLSTRATSRRIGSAKI